MSSHSPELSNTKRATVALGLIGVAALGGVTESSPISHESAPQQLGHVEGSAEPTLHPNFVSVPSPEPIKAPTVGITPTTLPSLAPIVRRTSIPVHASQPETTKPVNTTLPIMHVPAKSPQTPTPTPTETATSIPTAEPTPTETKGPIVMHPEQLSVPESIKEIMDKNVVHIPELGCSGFLVRNPEGIAIGVRTAEHCNLLPQSGHWSTTEQDKSVSFNFSEPIVVKQGVDFGSEQPVDTITQLIVTNVVDKTRDNALGVFANSTPEEVLANSSQMTPEEIGRLKTGDVIYNSGFPTNQKFNNGPVKRQDFAMSVLGQAEWQVTNGERLKLLIAAVPLSKDGAECSWGNSGSEAFITRPDVSVGIIGTASAFNDFGNLYNNATDGANERAYAENYFGVDLSGYVALCGFAYEMPSAKTNMVVGSVNTKPSSTETTPTPFDETREYAIKTFEDPTHDRTIIDGIVSVATGKGEFYVERPEIILDAETGLYAVISYSTELKGHEAITVLNELSDLNVYSRDGQTASFDHQVGAVTDNGTSFTLDNGYTIGISDLGKGINLNNPMQVSTGELGPADFTFTTPPQKLKG